MTSLPYRFIFKLISQALPHLFCDGVPCPRLIAFLSINEVSAASTSAILSLYIKLEEYRRVLLPFVWTRMSPRSRSITRRILTGYLPTSYEKIMLTNQVITLFYAFLKINTDVDLLDNVIDHDVKSLSSIIAEEEARARVRPVTDIECELLFTRGHSHSYSPSERWSYLSIFSNPASCFFSLFPF